MTTEVPRDLVFKCKGEGDKWHNYSFPYGLFGYIVSTFDNPQDFKNVQLVCRSWRAWIQRHFLVQHHLIERQLDHPMEEMGNGCYMTEIKYLVTGRKEVVLAEGLIGRLCDAGSQREGVRHRNVNLADLVKAILVSKYKGRVADIPDNALVSAAVIGYYMRYYPAADRFMERIGEEFIALSFMRKGIRGQVLATLLKEITFLLIHGAEVNRGAGQIIALQRAVLMYRSKMVPCNALEDCGKRVMGALVDIEVKGSRKEKILSALVAVALSTIAEEIQVEMVGLIRDLVRLDRWKGGAEKLCFIIMALTEEAVQFEVRNAGILGQLVALLREHGYGSEEEDKLVD